MVPHAPPPFISSEPPLRTEPLPDPPHGVTGSPDPAPDRVGPSQPPLNFVDGNGYIVLRGLVEARDCEVGWNKVMKAWGSGDEKVVAKNFELLFNAARSEEQAKDHALPRRWQSKSTLGSGVGGPLFTHLWIDHIYYFAKKWRILSKLSCFAMEGSHRRLKRMLRNSGGLSLLRGRLGVQVVVDNHTIDDSLWLHGWDATKRAQHGQGPISVQTYASRTRRRLLTDMQHLQTLQRRFRCRKRRT